MAFPRFYTEIIFFLFRIIYNYTLQFYTIFEQINFISEELIKSVKCSEAIELVSDIDEDDTPFVALALELNAFLWTGDKKLIDGLASKNTFCAKSTADIENLILPSL